MSALDSRSVASGRENGIKIYHRKPQTGSSPLPSCPHRSLWPPRCHGQANHREVLLVSVDPCMKPGRGPRPGWSLCRPPQAANTFWVPCSPHVDPFVTAVRLCGVAEGCGSLSSVSHAASDTGSLAEFTVPALAVMLLCSCPLHHSPTSVPLICSSLTPVLISTLPAKHIS